MLISDIGEIVDHYKELTKLDALIDAAKSGKINIQVQGQGMGEEFAETLQSEVVSQLRIRRNNVARLLTERFGFSE